MKTEKINLLLTVLIATSFLFGFSLKEPSIYNIAPEISFGNTDDIKGLRLMSQYCLSCHNPDMGGGHDSRLGPPIFKVREHYYREGISKEEFISSILNFVKKPSENKTKMKGAVRNFGLMPPLVIPQEDLEIIVNYIYENDLSSDAWKKEWNAFKEKSLLN